MLVHDMAVICPTVTTSDDRSYREAIEQVSEFAERLHIDFADGEFAPSKLVPVEDAWWPIGHTIDFHIMYKRPLDVLEDVVQLQPNLAIVHAEADHTEEFINQLDGLGIYRGVALLKETPVDVIKSYIHELDHVLIFGGSLGYYGGAFDESLLAKVTQLKALNPKLEIGWDGGIDVKSAPILQKAGVDVLNVGGAIQKASDPAAAYATLLASISK